MKRLIETLKDPKGKPPRDALLQPFESYEPGYEGILSQPFNDAETSRRIAELGAGVVTAYQAALAAEHEAVDKLFGQEEGEARAEAKAVLSFPALETTDDRIRRQIGALDRVHRDLEAFLDVSWIQEATDAQEIQTALDDALLADDVPSIRRVGREAVRRLLALEVIEARLHRKEPTHQNQVSGVRSAVQARFGAWLKEHPSPRVRLEEIEARRQSARMALQSEAQKVEQHLIAEIRRRSATPARPARPQSVVMSR
jgi:hypothetical protein